MESTGEAAAAAAAAARRGAVQFGEAEQELFVRRADPVFGGVVFWISPAYGGDERARIERLLQQGGARPAAARHEERGGAGRLNGVLVRALPQMASHIARFRLPRSGGGASAEAAEAAVTHVVSPDVHFGEYAACVAAGVSVVTARWVERSAAAGWRYVERFFSAAAEDIFSGMVVVPTQMPASDKEGLLSAVMALGGQWRAKMRPDVTHLVLLRDEGPRFEYARAHPECGIAAILPHWFKDTLNLRCRVPQEPYTFPDPPLLRGLTERPAAADKQAADKQAAEKQAADKQAADKQAADKQAADGDNRGPLAVPRRATSGDSAFELPTPGTPFLAGYAVAVETRLLYSLSPDARARLAQRLREAGAEVLEPAQPLPGAPGSGGAAPRELPESLVADWERVDILLCQHREGYDYSKASRLGKLVGTLVWLYQAFLTEVVTPPTRRLLHYPPPTTGVPGMARLRITISNYVGDARKYLQCLVAAMGAEFTPTMGRSTTHLVTACPAGAKYERAMAWNVDVVNHFWLEHCFQQWKLLSVSHPTFTYFPQLPVLGSLVGDTEVSLRRLGRWVDAAHGGSAAESSDMDILNDSDLEDGAGAVAVKTDRSHIYEVPAQPPPPAGSESGDDEEELHSVADSDGSGQQEPGADGPGADGPGADGPAGRAVLGQLRHTSRAAAMAASKTLNEMMQAANIFETEMRRERLCRYRRGAAGRRTLVLGDDEAEAEAEGAAADPPEAAGRAKRDGADAAAAEASLAAAATTGGGGGAKRARTSAARVRIMFTQVRPTLEEQERILDMGGEIVDAATDATHLVCKSVKRTFKMLMALASGRVMILGRNWMEDSLERGQWISVDIFRGGAEAAKYSVVDHEAEERWKFRLDESLRRAHRRRLLEGVTVLVTRSVQPAFATLRPLVEIAGGEAVETLPPARLQRLLKANVRAADGAQLPLLVVSCKEDQHRWPEFRIAPDQRVPIYCVEVILTGMLRQQILPSSREFDVTSP
ncbi:regulator of Ty1 Transposition [Coemansia javaensis]|uniref:Regulator of Ty1 Transposition n=1 Tax=Coemansia javaensis TaxID=2761396 RepID=A0A9W8LKV2_9FUNG|nr:regulator of Ty1 Transposition [Coemansia javaensis]